MNVYSILSNVYDLIDKLWFVDKGKNPRDIIEGIIQNQNYKVLDMCCGTFSNGLPIARKNSKNKVIGLDRSDAMLKEAKKKIKEENLDNVKFICRDATRSGLESGTFDYVILGLVLHECREDLWNALLDEARRLLKDDGKLIVLEWDKQTKLSRKIKFFPLYLTEILGNPRCFVKFYYSDKKEFFGGYRLKLLEKYECNYTSVMVLEKSDKRSVEGV